MQIGAVWDAKVTHLNYTLKGKATTIDDAVITGIDKYNNLCVIANLSAEQLTKNLTDHLYETFGIKKHES